MLIIKESIRRFQVLANHEKCICDTSLGCPVHRDQQLIFSAQQAVKELEDMLVQHQTLAVTWAEQVEQLKQDLADARICSAGTVASADSVEIDAHANTVNGAADSEADPIPAWIHDVIRVKNALAVASERSSFHHAYQILQDAAEPMERIQKHIAEQNDLIEGAHVIHRNMGKEITSLKKEILGLNRSLEVETAVKESLFAKEKRQEKKIAMLERLLGDKQKEAKISFLTEFVLNRSKVYAVDFDPTGSVLNAEKAWAAIMSQSETTKHQEEA
jgi:hypothetical protein